MSLLVVKNSPCNVRRTMETIGRYVFSQSALTALVWPRSEDEVRKSALLYSFNGAQSTGQDI